MTQRRWLKNEADGSLCLDGYPIRIRITGRTDMPYKLEQDGRMALPYWTLGSAKLDGGKRADELDEIGL
jgi:hypothetical protein